MQSYQRFRDSLPGRVHQDWDGQRNKGKVRETRQRWEKGKVPWESMDLIGTCGAGLVRGKGRVKVEFTGGC